jgi:predicted nuclease with TOPRIM domain
MDDDKALDGESESTETEDSVDEQPKAGSSDEAKKAFKARDKAKAEARELRDQLAKFEAEKAELEEAKERAAGEWSKLDARKQKMIEDLKAKVDSYEQEKAQQAAQQRHQVLVDEVCKASNTAQYKGRIAALIKAEGIEAPDEIDKQTIVDVIERLKEVDASTFAPEKSRRTPSPGLNTQSKSTAELATDLDAETQRIIELAQRGSTTPYRRP